MNGGKVLRSLASNVSKVRRSPKITYLHNINHSTGSIFDIPQSNSLFVKPSSSNSIAIQRRNQAQSDQVQLFLLPDSIQILPYLATKLLNPATLNQAQKNGEFYSESSKTSFGFENVTEKDKRDKGDLVIYEGALLVDEQISFNGIVFVRSSYGIYLCQNVKCLKESDFQTMTFFMKISSEPT